MQMSCAVRATLVLYVEVDFVSFSGNKLLAFNDLRCAISQFR